MTRAVDVLIVGGGIAGVALAWHLVQRRERRVVLLEREPTLGSMASAQSAAILRTFDTDPVVAEIGRRSAAFLRCPPRGFAPVPLVDPRGLLIAASREAALALERALELQGAPAGARRVSPGEARTLAPELAGAADLFLHFADEGRLDVAAMITAFERGAREGGAEILAESEVRRLLVARTAAGERVGGVELADGQRLEAEQVVLAAGGWAGRLGKEAGSQVELLPTRRHLLVTASEPRLAPPPDPAGPAVWVEDAGFYARPEGRGMLLCACDEDPIDPDRCVLDPGMRARITEKTARHLPRLADAPAARYWCGTRTLTADGRSAVGPDPDLPGLFWAAGLGGHGMTCGSELGRLAAARLLGAASREDEELLRALDPARLARSVAA